MATREKMISAWKKRACAELAEWLSPRGKKAEVARMLGYNPAQLSRVTDPESPSGGSPEFVERLQEQFIEWRPLWDEYLAIRGGDEKSALSAKRRSAIRKRIAVLRREAHAAIDEVFEAAEKLADEE